MNITSPPGNATAAGEVPGQLVALWTLASMATVVSFLVSGLLIVQHLRNYRMPSVQRYVVRILFIVPVYSLYAILACFLPAQAVYISILRDLYEAYVLFQFFRVCIEMAGGEQELLEKTQGAPPVFAPWPFCRKYFTLNEKTLRRLKQLVLQLVIIRPLTSIVVIVTEAFDVYQEGNFSFAYAYVYVVIIYNVSLTISLYGLFAFYLAVKDVLRPWHPMLKFLAIKVVVFILWWQGLLFGILVGAGLIPAIWKYSPLENSIIIQSFLVSIELVGIAILHIWSYPVDPFRVSTQSQFPLVASLKGGKGAGSAFMHSMKQSDTLQDTLDAFGPAGRAGAQSDFDESLDIEQLPEDSTKIKRQARR